MGYCEVDGHFAYIPKDVWNKYKESELSKLSAIEQAKYNINNLGDHTRNRILAAIVKNYESLYQEAPELFINLYVNFNFSGKEAEENAKPLLDCFCNLYSFSTVSEVYNPNQPIWENPIADDLERNQTPYLLFNQYISINSGNLLKRIFSKKEYRTITTVIKTKEVKRIKGNLSYFKIFTETNCFLFSEKQCSILPVDKILSEKTGCQLDSLGKD